MNIRTMPEWVRSERAEIHKIVTALAEAPTRNDPDQMAAIAMLQRYKELLAHLYPLAFLTETLPIEEHDV